VKNQDKKSSKKDKKSAPAPSSKKGERKRCKTPRGLVAEKIKRSLLDEVTKAHKRHRNDYNHRLAAAAKLARML
jgi:hypothetical protein